MAKTPKGPIKNDPPVDTAIISEADRIALSAEAAKTVAADMQQAARDKFYSDEVARLKRGHTPEDQLVRVTIDCAPYVPFIMLDHVQFFHAYSYEVPSKQAVVLYEQMQRSWHHQDEIDGRGKTEAFRRPSNIVLGPRQAGQPTRGPNGPVNAEI